ncbi:MAG: formylglycine-generating enzyme family protein [Saprospiraceae bacterium]|nr:formylglycine-generating enzyme family protein [Saprospiraceae bacterium]
MKNIFLLFFAALISGNTDLKATPTLPCRHDPSSHNVLWPKVLSDTMLPIQGGTFQMGSAEDQSDAKPIHSVTVSDFYLAATEVTNAQYCAFLNEKGNQLAGGVTWIDLSGKYELEKCRIQQLGSRFLVENGYEEYQVSYVSWYGDQAYCDWLTTKSQDKLPYRLPTEAEWEYAASGGEKNGKTRWAGTSNAAELYRYANFCDNNCNEFWKKASQTDGYTYLAPVGKLQPNILGLFDMSGNVQEWCSDRYDADYYQKSPAQNPPGPATGAYRVLRGGGWNQHLETCCADRRAEEVPTHRNSNLGFRVAR